MQKIGIITSGGDCGGLNAVIKGATLAALQQGIRCYIIPNGYAGLYNLLHFESLVELTPARLDAFESALAGSEAGHSRVNIRKINDPEKYQRIRAGLEKFELDGLIISGGDDTGSVMVDLAEHGINCVHAPKTMDLDLQTYSVGADSTISRIASFARDLRTTGKTHNRVIVMEVFGRYAGHTAFRGGVAAEADAILIPEISVDFDLLYQHMKQRYFERLHRSDVHAGTYLIMVAEGMRDSDGEEFTDSLSADAFGHKKLGGAGQYVSTMLSRRLREDPEIPELMQRSGVYVPGLNEIPEVRAVNPGHLVRCGQSSAYDVNFGLEAGAAALHLLHAGISGVTVSGVHGGIIHYMETAAAIRQRFVDLDHVLWHENLGTCFGRTAVTQTLTFRRQEGSPQRHL
ncbi:MAG: 6-phosphofructokinase [Thiolinea sp.]